VDKITRAFVGARRMLAVLAVERVVSEPAAPLEEPQRGVPLVDEVSGLFVEPGLLTCIASPIPDEAAEVAARLGRLSAGRGVRLGERRLEELSLAAVRRRIVVSEQDSHLFAGDLRGQLDPWGRARSDAGIHAALAVANAQDVLDALPEGLDAEVDERGRSFSGGQRQRLVLARALLADSEILVLVEPTSAVDAHTESRIARDLRAARLGRTTVVVTTSPLVLDRADRVVLLDGATVVGGGTHRELLRSSELYRETVTRGEAE
jgi:ABC-type multidrug transport system fused ATPase/permease subunit